MLSAADDAAPRYCRLLRLRRVYNTAPLRPPLLFRRRCQRRRALLPQTLDDFAILCRPCRRLRQRDAAGASALPFADYFRLILPLTLFRLLLAIFAASPPMPPASLFSFLRDIAD
jgi:hypothetical protein